MQVEDQKLRIQSVDWDYQSSNSAHWTELFENRYSSFYPKCL